MNAPRGTFVKLSIAANAFGGDNQYPRDTPDMGRVERTRFLDLLDEQVGDVGTRERCAATGDEIILIVSITRSANIVNEELRYRCSNDAQRQGDRVAVAAPLYIS